MLVFRQQPVLIQPNVPRLADLGRSSHVHAKKKKIDAVKHVWLEISCPSVLELYKSRKTKQATIVLARKKQVAVDTLERNHRASL